MRHIKLFEDYSEEEINSLRDDLYGIGADKRFELGKDFGFKSGIKLDKTIDGESFPCITSNLFNFLLRKGKIERKITSTRGVIFTFTDDNEFNIPAGLHSRILPADRDGDGKIMTIQISKNNSGDYLSSDEYVPIFTKVIEALGKIRT